MTPGGSWLCEAQDPIARLQITDRRKLFPFIRQVMLFSEGTRTSSKTDIQLETRLFRKITVFSRNEFLWGFEKLASTGQLAQKYLTMTHNLTA